MKKHEIIKHAYENYPKGTVYTWAKDTLPREVTSSGKFYFKKNELYNDLELHDQEDKDLAVWNGEEWAEIVNQKIAIRVENDKEFKALMKYYDSLGWKSAHTLPDKFNVEEHEAVDFHDSYHWDSVKVQSGKYAYQIIPFAEFAKEKGIKLPLHKSVDGVDLYEDDPYVMVKNIPATNNEWKITREDVKLKETHFPITDPDRCLAFSTKQAALSWIEAQKPKNVIISPDSSYPIIVYRNPVCGNEYIHLDMSKRGDYNGANIHLTIHELRQALKAYDEMHS